MNVFVSRGNADFDTSIRLTNLVSASYSVSFSARVTRMKYALVKGRYYLKERERKKSSAENMCKNCNGFKIEVLLGNCRDLFSYLVYM